MKFDRARKVGIGYLFSRVVAEAFPEGVEFVFIEFQRRVIDRMRQVEPYLFPPLVQFRGMAASDYVPGTGTQELDAGEATP